MESYESGFQFTHSPFENPEHLNLFGESFSSFFSDYNNIDYFVRSMGDQSVLAKRRGNPNEFFLKVSKFNGYISFLTFLSHSPDLGDKFDAYLDKNFTASMRGIILRPNPRRIQFVLPERKFIFLPSNKRFVQFYSENVEHRNNIINNIELAGIEKFCLPIEDTILEPSGIELADQNYISLPLGDSRYDVLEDFIGKV
jgi:hypothetical protein